MTRGSRQRVDGARARCAAVLILLVVGCGSPAAVQTDASADGSGPNTGLPVGSPCTADMQCDSPSSPECLAEIKPLASLAGVPSELAELGLIFPDGYCSSVLNCAGDVDCGERGACYRPFRDVTDDTLRALEPPLGVSSGTLDFLPTYGVCLRGCAEAEDCEVGQLCALPLADFISLVPGAVNDTLYCIPDPSCPPTGCTAGACSPNPCQNGGTCAESGTDYTCTCVEGFSGPTCATQTVVPDREIGESCTSDAQCNVRGMARCLQEVHPLMAALPPTEFLAAIGLDFPRGYCSNQPDCASNIECGPHGKCLAPFRNVTDQTLRDLEGTFDPPLAQGALDFLGSYGVCLRACTDGFECFSDQACGLVMAEFIAQVPGSVNSQTYCVPHEDCRFCNSHAHCAVDANDNGQCVCDPGYTGNGLTCTATGAGACAASPCEHGGTCIDGENQNYTCACPTGYSGTNCQIAAACTPNPCQNAGTCTPTGATTFTCSCPAGYSGATCQSVSMCAALSAPLHGDVSVASQLAGGTAQYECDTGYALVGTATRTCGSDGAWSGAAPTCTAVADPCGTGPCQHGGVCSPGTGTAFTCSCVGTGYSGTTCADAVNCGALAAVANATIVTVPVATTTFGAVATYACASGYTLEGSATRVCEASGVWSGAAPICRMQTSNPCSPNPCLNSGVCTATGGTSYACGCASGYSGTNCQTPFDCGVLSPPANGSVTAATTTLGASASYACNSNFTLVGTVARTCQATGWSGAAPTCMASSCGAYTDVIYRLTAKFEVTGTTFGVGDQSFTGLTNNATAPPFASSTNTTPFAAGTGTFARAFARLRFVNNASGVPIAGSVRLVEWYMPLEFTQTAGATLQSNMDHSQGILSNPGALTNCGGGDATCTNHAPTIQRTCAAGATGTLAGTSVTWSACTPEWTGANSWSYANRARSAIGAGCANQYVQYGNNTSSSFLVPAAGKGDAYQVYNQQLAAITFSSADYLTATWTMARIQIPNGTGQSNTWLTVTNATPIGTDCGTVVGVDLTCSVP